MRDEINRYFENQKCKICHCEAKHYVTFRNEWAYLCNKKECNYKFDLEAKIFEPEIAINEAK
jgi:hypothetical protein